MDQSLKIAVFALLLLLSSTGSPASAQTLVSTGTDRITSFQSPPVIYQLRATAMVSWGVGMCAVLSGFYYDGKGSDARLSTQNYYDDHYKNGTIDEALYHEMRKKIQKNRSYRNALVAGGAGLILGSGAMFLFAEYFERQLELESNWGYIGLKVNL